MKKTYKSPEVELHSLEARDMISTSDDNRLEWDTTEN